MSDGLAAETRQLLDAATDLTDEWYIERTYNKSVPDHWSVDVLSDDDHVCSVRGADEGAHALAALIAAAPRLLANWLARDSGPPFCTKQEYVRVLAERDRLADENRALRERLDAVERLFSNDPDSSVRTTYRREWSSSNGDCMVSSQPVECAEVPLDDLRSVLAAADRGDTDGEAT